jgi:hypothetical protein
MQMGRRLDKSRPPHFQWHRCKASPSREAQDLIRACGPEAVWQVVGACTPVVMPPPAPLISSSDAPAAAAPATATKRAKVTAAVLNLRADPSTTRPPKAQLVRGTQLEVLGQQGSWCKVLVDGHEGFVHADLIAFFDTRKPAAFLREVADLQSVPLNAAEIIPLPPVATPRMVAATWNSYGGLLNALCQRLQVPPAAAVAVLCTESSGHGFTNDKITIRFEVHQFYKHWGKQHRELFDRNFRFDPDEPHKSHVFSDGSGPFTSFHGDQAAEWRVFEAARGMDNNAALMSISMGLAQVMGFNYEALGYSDALTMFTAMQSDIRHQIIGMFDYIKGSGTSSLMIEALQTGNYEAFAIRYNGAGQVEMYGRMLRGYANSFEALCNLQTQLR